MNIKHTTAALILALGMPLGIAALPGCGTTGSQRLDTTTSTMANIEKDLDEGELRIEALFASLNTLDNAEDIDKSYRAFDRAVSDIEKTAASVRARRVAMETRAAEHVAQWQSESTRLSGDRAQEISSDRRAEFEDSVDSVSDELDALRAAYDPFIVKLQDLRVVLKNDLTRPGVQRTQPLRASLAELADDLREQTADTREALQEARADFAR